MTISDIYSQRNLLLNHKIIKERMAELASDMATGQRTNLLRDAPEKLHTIDQARQKITHLSAYATAGVEVSLKLEQLNLALSHNQNALSNFGDRLDVLKNSARTGISEAISLESKAAAQTMISALQTKVGGAYIFGGVDGSRVPITDFENLYTDLHKTLSGSASISEFRHRVDQYFDPETSPYKTQMLNLESKGQSETQVSKNSTLPDGLDLFQPEIIAGIKAVMSIAIASSEPEFAEYRDQEISRYSNTYRARSDDLISLQSKIGIRQNRLENIKAENQAEKHALELFLSNELSTDTAEAITQFQNAQTQLEALYNVTARLSQLSLVKFL